MSKSHIEWTEATWNPVTGCTKVGAGCKHCYAERMAKRLQAMGQAAYANGFELTLQHDKLLLPLSWIKPQTIFVNSMSDLFHQNVPDDYIKSVFEVMNQAHWHRFQVLTKRSDRLRNISSHLNWTSNIWMGVSIENQDVLYRVDDLRHTNAFIKFLSLEPLIGPLQGINLQGIDWAIVGGESGPGARPISEEWIVDIQKQCKKSGVAFFFKQWGGVNKKRHGRLLRGKTWDEMPSKTL